MKNRRITILFIASMLILSCSFPLTGGTGTNPLGTALPISTAANALTAAVASPAHATSTIPLAMPNGQPLNCRSGPGTSWPVSVILSPGQSTEIAGKSPDGSWWYVKNPASPGNFCWISAAFTSTSGDLGDIPLAAVPPTIALPSPLPANVVVTNVYITVNPKSIHVPGCIGPIQPSTVNATVTVNGAIKLQYHFETDQNGPLSTHSANFKAAGSKDLTDNFTPPLDAGTHQVQLFIDGMNLNGMNTVATYKITC